jgi:hypothetical protein
LTPSLQKTEHCCMSGRFALLVVGVVAVCAPGVMAAAPIKGGHYRMVARLDRGMAGLPHEVAVDFIIANDGRELAAPSSVWWQLRCDSSDFQPLYGRYTPYRAVPVAADGTFLFRGRREPGFDSLTFIKGGFARGGRVAVGSLAIGGALSCAPVRLAFRAPLVGRPDRPHPGSRSVCDRVTIHYFDALDADEAYRVYDSGIGCTTAREIARQWRASRRCRRLSVGGRCWLPGATCEAVQGGTFNALVSARCMSRAHPRGATEFVHYRPCLPPNSQTGTVTMWAINLDCHTATAFPVDALNTDDKTGVGPCGRDPWTVNGRSVACAPVAGFVCRVRAADIEPDGGWHARCVQQRDGFGALELDYAND